VNNQTWILLADSASARLYQTDEHLRDWAVVREFNHPEGRAKESELVSDKPGRVQQSRGYRSAMEPPTPRKKVEAERFARLLADVLDQGVVSGAYQRLIVVAAPPFLGELRSALSDRVSDRALVIDKDYLHLDPPQVKQRLQEQLRPR
jgi:protein required for attachment to host cells